MDNNIFDLFSQKAERYDLVTGAHYYGLLDQIFEKIKLRPAEKILDLGSGTGEILLKIARKYKDLTLQLTGVDFSPAMISVANKKTLANENSFISRPSFFCQDLIDYLSNCRENSYDLVLTSFMLAYVKYSELFKLANKVLNKGGKLIILTTPKGFFKKIENIFFNFILFHPFYINWWALLTKKFSLTPSIEEITGLLSKYNFSKIETNKFTVSVPFPDPLTCLKWLDECGIASLYLSLIKKSKKDAAMPAMIDYLEKKSIRFEGQPIKRGKPLRFDWEIYSIIAEK